MNENEQTVRSRGRPARPLPSENLIINTVVKFLLMFMPEVLAKRVVVVILIALDTTNDRITEATGVSARSITRLKSTMNSGNMDELFSTGYGIGRPGKAKGFESEIVDELERNNYHTRQQVADMISEKFGITMSVSAVGKLLKKTASGD
jgi:transposase